MSNATAAYYAYLALKDRDTARVFRSFGYHASAQVLERRAARHEAMAEREEAPADEPIGASCFPSSNHGDSDLHRTSYGHQESG